MTYDLVKDVPCYATHNDVIASRYKWMTLTRCVVFVVLLGICPMLIIEFLRIARVSNIPPTLLWFVLLGVPLSHIINALIVAGKMCQQQRKHTQKQNQLKQDMKANRTTNSLGS